MGHPVRQSIYMTVDIYPSNGHKLLILIQIILVTLSLIWILYSYIFKFLDVCHFCHESQASRHLGNILQQHQVLHGVKQELLEQAETTFTHAVAAPGLNTDLRHPEVPGVVHEQLELVLYLLHLGHGPHHHVHGDGVVHHGLDKVLIYTWMKRMITFLQNSGQDPGLCQPMVIVNLALKQVCHNKESKNLSLYII